jgi:thiol-disulfide isomerase/thioredoxin
MRNHSFARSSSVLLILIVATTVATADVWSQTDSQRNATHLYFFTNHGCAPCRQVEPGIQALAREGYPVSTIYVNQQPQFAQRFQVNRTPTVIMVANNKVVGRHAGLIDGVTLKQWFAAVGVNSGTAFKDAEGGTKVELPSTSATPTSRAWVENATEPAASAQRSSFSETNPMNGTRSLSGVQPFNGSATMHQGTDQPTNAAEERALRATVRLKVEDPEGISYATGTVIHSHQNESLVMTCGHVFREAGRKGEITAELGFADGQVISAPGQLISYDAEARDIGLVAIRSGCTPGARPGRLFRWNRFRVVKRSLASAVTTATIRPSVILRSRTVRRTTDRSNTTFTVGRWTAAAVGDCSTSKAS